MIAPIERLVAALPDGGRRPNFSIGSNCFTGSKAMRWKPLLTGLLLAFLGILGCKQQCFMTEADIDHYRQIGMPAELDCTPGPQIAPPPEAADIPPPATIHDPDKPPRFISLAECIALALEQGTVGTQFPLNRGNLPSIYQDVAMVSFNNGTVVAGSDNIRVLSLNPAMIQSNIESALSKFDARLFTSLNWTTTDQPIGTPLQTFQAINARGVGAINMQQSTMETSLLKPLPTGGVAGITLENTYTNSNLNPRVNPSWQPLLQFQFEQPLLQGFGVDINQLRSTHPGSILTPYLNTSRVEGILITRIRFDQARAELERNLNYLLLNVETIYWNLYGAYWALYAQEQALRQAFEAWRINKARYEAGRIPIQDFAQSRGQYELFRSNRVTALGNVLEQERQLRGITGLPVEDGKRLVPIDEPITTRYVPDWRQSLQETENLRPELVLCRQDLKFRQLNVINQKNLLLPDLRFTSTYDVNALGGSLYGGPLPAMNVLSQGQYNDWSVGLQMTMPLGFRDAHAAVRAARLQLAQSYNQLRDQELKAQRQLGYSYQKLFQFYQLIETYRAQREAYGTQLEARFREFRTGRGTLDFLLEAQRNWADALNQEYNAITQYNATIASFQFSKGTIMQFDNVYLSEGALPQCAQVRAVDHERERSRALVLRERAVPMKPLCQDGCGCEKDPLMQLLGISKVKNDLGNGLALPVIPSDSALPVPSLYKDATPVPEIDESAPQPRPLAPGIPGGMMGQGPPALNQTTMPNGDSLPARIPLSSDGTPPALPTWGQGLPQGIGLPPQ